MAARIYNAWVPTIDTVFDPVLHARTELVATTYKLDHEEGGVARLTITCKNLGIGIMAPGRDQYILVSVSNDGETPKLIFRGVANSMPANLAENLISLEFLGQPDEFDDLLLAFARTLATRPYVDELISGTNISDPAVVLEARSELFHIDPVTHEITLSDIIDYDRLVDLGPHYVRDSMVPALGAPPIREASLNIVGEWAQSASGAVDISGKVNEGGGVNGRPTLTDVSSIGEVGELVNSGWQVKETQQAFPDATETSRKYFDGRYQVVLHQRWSGKNEHGVDQYESYVRTRYGVMPLAMWRYKATKFEMSYDYRQPRREILKVTATADVQDVRAFGYEEEELDDIGLNSLTEDSTTPMWEEDTDYLVGDKVIFYDQAWVCQVAHNSGDDFQDLLAEWLDYPESLIKPYMYRWVRTRKDIALHDEMAFSFFETDRGRQVAEHGLLRVRAYLRRRLRALTVTFRARWEDLYDITLRDGVRIEHHFFPAGWVRGKVISYSKVWTAEGMVRYVDVTLGVSVANGVSGTVPDGGTPYSEAFAKGYAWADNEGVGYQVGDMQYTMNGERIQKPVNPYLLKQASYACKAVRWKNGYADQLRVAAASQVGFGNAVAAVSAVPTAYQLIMRQLTAKDVIERELTATGATVTARKDIDLAFAG
ncbi:hypothetical protein CFBP5875_01370 [Agrobacterium pusense]|uniref:hypothetical protein n=1 Tax=Agrobacterium pusense TaxID=648995 RepID=UPI0010BE55DC|nr:hypothetical protein [Agrobacterium pusense]QCL83342.1 hypothetical protein CFBP5875_01370 [Agrobacterium pusense]